MFSFDMGKFQRYANKTGHDANQMKTYIERAMYDAAYTITAHVKNSEIPGRLHLRNGFTKYSFRYNKEKLGFEIGFDAKAWYMKKLDHDKHRTPLKHKYFAIPTPKARGGSNLGLPKGEMSMKSIKLGLSAKGGKHWIMEWKGKIAICKREGKGKSGIVVLYWLVPSTDYLKGSYFPFYKVIKETANKIHFEDLLISKIKGALK